LSREPRIDAYIAKAQPFARPILSHIREWVHAAVPEAEEAMKWSAPAFVLNGKILIVMAAFKAHAATAVEWLSDGKRRHWKYQNC